MIIAVSAQGKDLSSLVDPRFGRARYFLVVNTDDETFSVHDNAQNLSLPQGAGIQAGQTVVNLGVAAVVTGHVGPKAFNILRAGKVAVYVGASGTVREAITVLKEGRLQAADQATVEGHWS